MIYIASLCKKIAVVVTAQNILSGVTHGIDGNIGDECNRIRVVFRSNFHVGAIVNQHDLQTFLDNRQDKSPRVKK